MYACVCNENVELSLNSNYLFFPSTIFELSLNLKPLKTKFSAQSPEFRTIKSLYCKLCTFFTHPPPI